MLLLDLEVLVTLSDIMFSERKGFTEKRSRKRGLTELCSTLRGESSPSKCLLSVRDGFISSFDSGGGSSELHLLCTSPSAPPPITWILEGALSGREIGMRQLSLSDR